MIHYKIHLSSPGCPRPSIALQVQNRGLAKTPFISFDQEYMFVFEKKGKVTGWQIFIYIPLRFNHYKNHYCIERYVFWTGRIRGTVVACWTAGQHVERSILHQGHDS